MLLSIGVLRVQCPKCVSTTVRVYASSTKPASQLPQSPSQSAYSNRERVLRPLVRSGAAQTKTWRQTIKDRFKALPPIVWLRRLNYRHPRQVSMYVGVFAGSIVLWPWMYSEWNFYWLPDEDKPLAAKLRAVQVRERALNGTGLYIPMMGYVNLGDNALEPYPEAQLLLEAEERKAKEST